MKSHHLLLKEHKITGKKYLCYHYGTRDNCYKYLGSGKYWMNHLQSHGREINTVILNTKDKREDLVDIGLYYSDLWDVVNSDEFANLIPEDCNSTCTPLNEPSVRVKRNEVFAKRIRENLTDKEKIRLKKMQKAAQRPDVRRRAADTLKATWSDDTKNNKLKSAQAATAARRRAGDYTFKEKEAYKRQAKKQQGKTMAERLSDPDYVDPRKGKTAKEIYGDDYEVWNKGIKMKDKYGPDYVDPKSKPFKITSHMGEKIYNSESEFIAQENFSAPVLIKLKKEGSYKVKRQKNTRHSYKNGETIYLEFIG